MPRSKFSAPLHPTRLPLTCIPRTHIVLPPPPSPPPPQPANPATHIALPTPPPQPPPPLQAQNTWSKASAALVTLAEGLDATAPDMAALATSLAAAQQAATTPSSSNSSNSAGGEGGAPAAEEGAGEEEAEQQQQQRGRSRRRRSKQGAKLASQLRRVSHPGDDTQAGRGKGGGGAVG
jgi:hypothetical protein